MTGCYARRVGLSSGVTSHVLVPGDPIGLSPDEVTVAGILRGCGYATKIIGKWHLGDQPEFLPTRHGFDEFFGLPYSNDMWSGHPNNDKLNMPPLPLMRGEDVAEVEPDQASLTARYTEEAIAFIREHREGPFFLYFPHMYVHAPLFPPEEFRAKSQNGDYGAEVECLDWSTGAILDTLAELGIDENTLVIFTSDNGASGCGSNLPLRGGKGSSWEGGVREPCIMRWPGQVPDGSECGEVTTVMDFLPTFARLAGAPVPGDRVIDGKDISPLMLGEPDVVGPHETFFLYNRECLTAVRSGQWKYFPGVTMPRYSGKGTTYPEALYNLAEDVGEQNDRLMDHGDVVERMRGLLSECRMDMGDGDEPGENCRPCGRVENPTTILPRPR